MIEISFGKLVLLALIALIVLGPEKLPTAARTAGALIRRLRTSWDSVRAEVERELEVDEIRRNAREAVARVDAAQLELDATMRQVRDAAVAANAEFVAAQSKLAAPAPDGAATPATPATAAPAASAAPSLAAEVDAPAPVTDTLTGDLFAAAEPPAAAPAAAPEESPHGGA